MIDFGGTFKGHGVQPFDIMIMVSHENADKVINTYKKIIDNLNAPLSNFTIHYDDTDILELDKKRIVNEISKYYRAKFDK